MVSFSSLSPSVKTIWAKSGPDGGHSLIAHLIDVAAVVETILEIEPESTKYWAAKHFGLSVSDLPRWIALLAGLHDFGKAIPGFQAKWFEGLEADRNTGLDFTDTACKLSSHDLATFRLLEEALVDQGSAKREWIKGVVQAISAYHGFHFRSTDYNRGQPLNEPPAWRKARTELLEAFWKLLSPQGEPDSDEIPLSAINWLAGLTSCTDWIASNSKWFPLGMRGFDNLSCYYNDARQRAKCALARIGWHPY